VSTFEYWHHTDEPQVELVPDCASLPIIVSNLPGTWYHDAVVPFNPDPITGSCPTMLSQFQNDDDSEDEITYAHNEAATLRDVYDDWSDGGDPTGLIDAQGERRGLEIRLHAQRAHEPVAPGASSYGQ
jgi:hypothetical protein